MIRAMVSELARSRLEVLHATADGFQIAEEDLKLRGSGEIVGTKQWGLPSYRVARLPRDFRLLEAARRQAERLSGDSAWMSSEQAKRLLERVPGEKSGLSRH